MVRTAQNKIFIFREGEKVQIEAYGEHIIRVRASKGEIENLNWTLLPGSRIFQNIILPPGSMPDRSSIAFVCMDLQYRLRYFKLYFKKFVPHGSNRLADRFKIFIVCNCNYVSMEMGRL